MGSKWLNRRDDASLPFQTWDAFPPEAIVQVRSAYYPDIPDAIGPARNFWWGYEEDLSEIGEGVIVKARRLDKPKEGFENGK
jgi:hypothetical protein